MTKFELFYTKYFTYYKPAKIVKIDIADYPYIEVELTDGIRLRLCVKQFVLKSINTYLLINYSFGCYELEKPITKEEYEYLIK